MPDLDGRVLDRLAALGVDDGEVEVEPLAGLALGDVLAEDRAVDVVRAFGQLGLQDADVATACRVCRPLRKVGAVSVRRPPERKRRTGAERPNPAIASRRRSRRDPDSPVLIFAASSLPPR